MCTKFEFLLSVTRVPMSSFVPCFSSVLGESTYVRTWRTYKFVEKGQTVWIWKCCDRESFHTYLSELSDNILGSLVGAVEGRTWKGRLWPDMAWRNFNQEALPWLNFSSPLLFTKGWWEGSFLIGEWRFVSVYIVLQTTRSVSTWIRELNYVAQTKPPANRSFRILHTKFSSSVFLQPYSEMFQSKYIFAIYTTYC